MFLNLSSVSILVGIKNVNPSVELDVTGEVHVTGNVDFDSDLNVDGNVEVQTNLDVNGIGNFNNTTDATSTLNAAVVIDGGVGISKKLFVGGAVDLSDTLNVDKESTFLDDVALSADGKTFKVKNAGLVDKFTITSDDGNTDIKGTLVVAGVTSISNTTQSIGIETGALIVKGGVGIGSSVYIGGDVKLLTNLRIDGDLDVDGHTELDNLNVTGLTTFTNIVDLEGPVRDQNNVIANPGAGKTDYRLSSVGTGVSWRPSGVQTKRTIWVSKNGLDSNSGLLEGDAKATIGGAAAIAVETDTIKVRPGIYIENNPIGLRTDVTVTGEDLRLVIIQAGNPNKDIFHVRRGCLIENLSFAGSTITTQHPRCGAVAFPPIQTSVDSGLDFQAVAGYTPLGPANEGAAGRWRSPYVRNCTNFMTGSIGMKINGDHADAAFTGTNDGGQDLKSMVCDSFTQYNEAGIGVSISNNGYAQLVSIFTIGCEIGIGVSSGGQCDLTNSNSSFGIKGLVADGFGDIEFTGISTNGPTDAQSDTVVTANTKDSGGNIRIPFDGQGVYFVLNMNNYEDSTSTATVSAPLEIIRGLKVLNGGNDGDYSAGAPPIITLNEGPEGPESILPEFSPNVSAAGTITSVDVLNSGRNFLPTQNLSVEISSGNATFEVITDPILFTVSEATESASVTGITTVTFNEFIPYPIFDDTDVKFVRLSRIITSSHSFEYIGAGTDINTSNPFQGGKPIPENEVIAINGGQVPFTSTDQKGNFRIGDGLTIDQTTSTIRGRDFNRAIQAQLTPLILALK
mgnify:CR=1 FL=1